MIMEGAETTMTRFYILRHGETEWNHFGNKYCGISDIQLNDNGRLQAEKAAAALRHVSIDAVYCSPLQRSRETALIIAQSLNLTPAVDERIREIDFGLWEGKTRDEIEAGFQKGWQDWTSAPGTVRAGDTGETGSEVWSRVQSFIVEKSAFHQNQSVLIVGHNTSNRMLIAGSVGLPFHKYRSFIQNNAAISVLESEHDELRWLQINQTAHLA